MRTAEDIEWQIAVAVVIGIEEAPLLHAMQRIVRRIEVEDDLLGRPRMRLQKHIDQQIPDRHWIVTDLVVARRLQLAQLQPVERRFARHRRALLALGRKLARQNRHHRVVAQLVMIVEVLVAECNRKYALTDQRRNLMLDQLRSPPVMKARRKPIDQSDRSIRRLQKQRASLRRHQATVKCGFHNPAFNHSKIERFWSTLCRHRGFLFESSKVAVAQRLSLIRNPDAPSFCEKSGLGPRRPALPSPGKGEGRPEKGRRASTRRSWANIAAPSTAPRSSRTGRC